MKMGFSFPFSLKPFSPAVTNWAYLPVRAQFCWLCSYQLTPALSQALSSTRHTIAFQLPDCPFPQGSKGEVQHSSRTGAEVFSCAEAALPCLKPICLCCRKACEGEARDSISKRLSLGVGNAFPAWGQAPHQYYGGQVPKAGTDPSLGCAVNGEDFTSVTALQKKAALSLAEESLLGDICLRFWV